MSGTASTVAGSKIFMGEVLASLAPMLNSAVLAANVSAASASTMRGVEEASRIMTLHNLSNQPRGRRAASEPSARAITQAIIRATTASMSVLTKAGRMIVQTGARLE